ncbi:MAG: type I-B CRISPR-associated protein Cas7/Csh2, partial [bacterium (Candidatus Stahlbacteria) CG23_combo_of_CG06-09_8_20_14_all_40_9]
PLELKVEGKDKPKTGSIALTGPVQFKFGRSLHRVKIEFIKGTGAFASDYETEEERNDKIKQKKKISSSTQFTFREEYILPYSLISFYGIVNENSAKETGLKQEDVNLLLEGMWNGTKNLITRTKAGQIPRFLMQVVYKEPNFHIGLDDLEKEKSELPDEKIRDIKEIKLNVTRLSKKLGNNREKIENIRYAVDGDLKLLKDGRDVESKDISPQGITVEEITF